MGVFLPKIRPRPAMASAGAAGSRAHKKVCLLLGDFDCQTDKMLQKVEPHQPRDKGQAAL